MVPYFVLEYLPVPLLGTQRVPARLATLPLVFAIAMACVGATQLLSVARRGIRLVAGVVGVAVAVDVINQLYRHALLWRMARIEARPDLQFTAHAFALPTIVSKPDPAYVAAVVGALALSLLTLVAIIWWLRRTHPAKADREQGQLFAP